MDPKMRTFVSYLRSGYRRPGEVGAQPRMSSEDYRTGEFVRGAPAHLPTGDVRALLAALRRGGGGRVASSLNHVED